MTTYLSKDYENYTALRNLLRSISEAAEAVSEEFATDFLSGSQVSSLRAQVAEAEKTHPVLNKDTPLTSVSYVIQYRESNGWVDSEEGTETNFTANDTFTPVEFIDNVDLPNDSKVYFWQLTVN